MQTRLFSQSCYKSWKSCNTYSISVLVPIFEANSRAISSSELNSNFTLLSWWSIRSWKSFKRDASLNFYNGRLYKLFYFQKICFPTYRHKLLFRRLVELKFVSKTGWPGENVARSDTNFGRWWRWPCFVLIFSARELHRIGPHSRVPGRLCWRRRRRFLWRRQRNTSMCRLWSETHF